MADESQVELARDAARWAAYRLANPLVKVDLRGANFDESGLVGDFSHALFDGAFLKDARLPTQLDGASFVGARMRYAKVGGVSGAVEEFRRRNANFREALLSDAVLRYADFSSAVFAFADLRGARLDGALLDGVDFTGANMLDCSLEGATITRAVFRGTNLKNAAFRNAICGGSTFDAVDLSEAQGLGEVQHLAPSSVNVASLIRSGGRIPQQFLAGAHPDAPEGSVTLLAEALRRLPYEYRSCFVSYAHADDEFVAKLSRRLLRAGVACWRDAQSLLSGERFEERISDAITRHDVLIVVLSEESLKRPWVEKELEIAIRLRGVERILPIRLDHAVLNDGNAVFRQIGGLHISDFSKWRSAHSFRKQFDLLLRALRRS